MDDRERRLAERLDALLEGTGGTSGASEPGSRPAADGDLGALSELTALAAALARLPAPPAPDAAFRARLSAALAVAPEPASLRVPVLPTTTVVQALDEALLRLDAGTPRDDVLAGLPLAADELRSLVALAAALEELPRTAGPSAPFRRALANQLAAAAPPSSLDNRRPVGGALGLWLRRLWASTAASAALAATVLLFAGAGLGVAARDAMPGDALHPVKLAVERLELWLAGDAGVTALRLEHARRRLDEALAVPALAVESLGRFTGDVASALGGADAALAAGAPRERVADPLVAWLGAARHDLIAAEARMPVASWRAARAVVDEGLLAFSSRGGLAERPVPRLAPGAEVLAARAGATHPWPYRVALAPLRPPVQPPASPARPAPEAGPPPAVQVAAAPALVLAPQAPTPAPPEPTRSSEPERPRRTSAPPRPTEAPAEPTEPPPVPSEPSVPTATVPPSQPTEPPAPSPTPGAPRPTVLELRCTPDPVKSAGTADCRVINLDGEAVAIAWTASMGRIEPIDGDPLSARFVDVGGISGVSRLFVTVTASLVPDPAWSGGEPPVGQVVIVVEPEHGVAP